MSTDSPISEPAATATAGRIAAVRATTLQYLQFGLNCLIFTAALVTLAIYHVRGDYSEPAPTVPPIPSFMTLDVLPQQGAQPLFGGPAGAVIDPDLAEGEVAYTHSRSSLPGMALAVKVDGRMSRTRLIVFDKPGGITLDGSPVDRSTLEGHLLSHRVKAVLHAGPFGPVDHAEFTTIQE